MKIPPAPPCGSAATKADMKKRRMATLACKVVEPTREKSPPLILASRLLQALGWPQPTPWKGKLAPENHFTPCKASLAPFPSPSLISFNFTDFLSQKIFIRLDEKTGGPVHCIVPNYPRGVIWGPVAPVGVRWITGWNSVELTVGSKFPVTCWDGSLCGSRWNYPSGASGGHLGSGGGSLPGVELLLTDIQFPGTGNPQPDTQTLNLSKHIIGTHS